jgi:hypothetical protein
MGQPQIDAVIAGTKGFAVAILAPVTARLGNRPRVAGDPGQVLGLCSGPSSLAIIEFTGEGSLAAIQALVRDGRGMRVVAGVPPAHAPAEGTLRALGVETVRWEGKVDLVVAAVDRALATGAAEPPLPPPAAAPAPAAAAPPAAARAAPPRPAAPPPAAAPGRPPPAAPRPAAPPAAAPAARPAPQAGAPGVATATAPRPAPRPAPAAARPPVPAAPPAQAAAPQRPPSVPALAPAAAPLPRPTAAAIAPPPPAPILAASPAPAPAIAPPASPPPPPAPAAEDAAAAAAPPPARPAAAFFADLEPASDLDVEDAAAPPPAPDFHAPGVYVPPAAAGRPQWPRGICSAADAGEALRRVMAGAADPQRPLHAQAERTLQSLSALERAVLAGEPQVVDAGPVQRAAVMRLRVADALASVPPPGGAVDGAALSGVLGEIDALLSEVNGIAAAAPEELKEPLDAVRNALVSEAIDFSEVAQRVAGAGAAAAAVARAAPRAPQARVLSIQGAAAVESSGRGRRIVMAVLLAAAVLLAGLYHGFGWYRRVQAHRPTPGLPSGMMDKGGPAKGARMLIPSNASTTIDPAELARFKATEEAKGNQVIDTGGGPVLVVPVPPAKAPATEGTK